MIFRRLFSIAGFLLLCVSVISAQEPHPAAPVPVEHGTIEDTARLENALLWRITHPDISEASYLFGTIHLIDADAYFLPAGTEAAMQRAEKFVFEIDMAEMMDLGAQLALLTKAFMPEGKRLKDLISAEDYALVEEHFREMGIPMILLDRIKPLFLTVFASPEIDPGSLSSGDMTSYEMEFFSFAQENGIPTGGLETMEFQLSVFDSVPYEAQAAMLVESIRGTDEQNDLFREMMDLYLAQDIEALYQAIGDDEMGAGRYEDILVRNRNRRWIAGIHDYMLAGPVFFAVGAGHLGGEDGVIRLLRRAGFDVQPVPADAVRDQKKF